MAIPLPVTRTIIQTNAWGIPITNAVNTNTTDIANLKTATAVTAWTALSLQNGWTNYGSGVQTLQYRKVGDIVYVRGGLKAPGTASVCATLPVGFRAPFQLEFPCTYYSGSRLVGAVTTSGDGTLNVVDTVPVNALLSLSIIAFSITP